jgi:transposase
MNAIVAVVRWFVGLDYHQSGVQVCVMDAEGNVVVNRKCANAWSEIVATVAAVAGERIVVRAAIEACCGAANLAKELADRAGWSVSLAHAGFVARMKQNPDKTDFSDAQLLADLLRVGYLPKVWLAPDEICELRRLVRYRQQLVGERRNLKLRIRAILRDERVQATEGIGNPWTLSWLGWLEEQQLLGTHTSWILQQHLTRLRELNQRVREVEKRLEEATADDALVAKLQTHKGIGLITAVTMRAEIGNFERFASGKQLARFCGLTPRNASSGTRQADAGLIKAGNPALRAVLIEAAHRLVRYEKRWVVFAAGLRSRGKPGCVVIAAVANRWMRWLYHRMQPEALAM